jgi:hypothetical protein
MVVVVLHSSSSLPQIWVCYCSCRLQSILLIMVILFPSAFGGWGILVRTVYTRTSSTYCDAIYVLICTYTYDTYYKQ